jgi:23S rRNA pseudouridine1911/1915/1917 synthase
MPRTAWGWEITPEEIARWTLHHDDHLLVIDKPAFVLCHPSKHGPWSSLVGACREVLGLARLHMPSRLDRETSGVVVLAKSVAMASRLQTAVQRGMVHKVYHAILCGELGEPVRVDRPIGEAQGSQVAIRRAVRDEGQAAVTVFTPLHHARGYTLARIEPRTGRLHQIRVHAAWLGFPVAGDKLYGPDETLFLDFIARGWTARHATLLPIERHALHASQWSYADASLSFSAPPPEDCRPLLDATGLCWPS